MMCSHCGYAIIGSLDPSIRKFIRSVGVFHVLFVTLFVFLYLSVRSRFKLRHLPTWAIILTSRPWNQTEPDVQFHPYGPV
jgi:hypothetical protein